MTRSCYILLTSAALGIPTFAFVACSPPLYLLPAESDGGDDDGDGSDGSDDDGTETPDPPPGPEPTGCDDPSTCEYDLETTCAGTPRADPASFSACPSSICESGGHCIPSALVPSDQLNMLESCDGSSECVPDAFIERGGLLTPAGCESIAGAEGRCLSTCLPMVASQAGMLPTSTCGAAELCVPCYDPFDGTATGACAVSCDSGPVAPAAPLPKCCQQDGGGTCVPSALVGAEEADRLDDEECGELGLAGAVCVPNIILDAYLVGEPFNPVECVTGAIVQELGLGSEGGCLPECIPIVGSIPVGQQDCAAGFRCVPCEIGGQETGACQPQ